MRFFRFEVSNKHDEDVKLYLSSSAITGTNSPENYYEMKYLISSTLENSFEATNYGTFTTVETVDGSNGVTVPAAGAGQTQTTYIYVAVKLRTQPEAGTLVTATFSLEFAADVAD